MGQPVDLVGSLRSFSTLALENITGGDLRQAQEDAGIGKYGIRPKDIGSPLNQVEILCAQSHVYLHGSFAIAFHLLSMLRFIGIDINDINATLSIRDGEAGRASA